MLGADPFKARAASPLPFSVYLLVLRGGGGGGVGSIGGAGGSGVVIMSILTAAYTGTTTGSPTVTTSGLYTILKFTNSGSYTA